MWNLFARPCEICEFCPVVEDIFIPDGEGEDGELHLDSVGMPKFVELMFRSTKGHVNVDLKFRLFRNNVNSKYCPVTAVMAWLAVSRITTGTIV